MIEGLRCHYRRLHLGLGCRTIYDPQLLKQGVKRLTTGYDYPGPHQGNFCANGIITSSREPSSKLAEVKAAHKWVKFDSLAYTPGARTAT